MNTCEFLERNAQRSPSSIAIIDGGKEYSWKEIRSMVSGFANYLASLGVGEGDRVVLVAQNSYAWMVVHYAAHWLGAVIVPINTRWSLDEIIFSIKDSEPKAICVDKLARSILSVQSSDLGFSADSIIEIDGKKPFEDYCARPSINLTPTSGTSIASIFYTGGTTGKSKGVMLSHDNHIIHSLLMITENAIQKGQCHLHVAPMFHIADALFIHIITMTAGVHIVMPAFDPIEISKHVRSYQIDQTILVPTMIQMLMSNPVGKEIFGSLSRLYYGASPMPVSLLESIINEFPKLELIQLYGQTESSPVLTVLSPEQHTKENLNAGLAKSAGRALLGTQVAICGEDGSELEVGKHGEIIAKGPQVFCGYWNREAESVSALRNGWLHTGDAGYIDSDGYVYVTDRIKDMIITGGENVYSVEVEQIIYQLPGVAECCVIASQDDKWGEIVHAIVVPKANSSISEADIKKICVSKLSSYKVPKRITIRSESLPVSGAGKLLKRELRNEYAT